MVDEKFHLEQLRRELFLLFSLDCSNCGTEWEECHDYWDHPDVERIHNKEMVDFSEGKSRNTGDCASMFSQVPTRAAYDLGWRSYVVDSPVCPKCAKQTLEST